ncbi:hypothetical protein Nepgr_010052 [Nepenthes gracilis]|uniref:Homeobox domain-containing protein n=1 Tax=Nepenthes gracilis TaxID=150966 RepID=A0AAD3SBW3_NEPGR|nr:hypothetical protein Nepgr_010052 [Nepenthes gracilis]
MELALSLGDTSKPFNFLEKKQRTASGREVHGFCMGLTLTGTSQEHAKEDEGDKEEDKGENRASSDPPLQLDLLPFSPVIPRAQPPSQLRFPWLSENLSSEPGSSDGPCKGLDVNRFLPVAAEDAEEQSSPNSAASSFKEFSLYRNGSANARNKRSDAEAASNGHETETEKATSRASDDEENGSTRKKLRLSKEQSAFLEESFKEHHTLNPKQKLALAKQLHLRPRQVEVWFQNRRARTKLKQTEVDCEYLKRCCETLTEENRRLQKELQELRALKTSQPFYMQLPATTLTMCPSCERVATSSTAPGNQYNNTSPAAPATKPAHHTVASAAAASKSPSPTSAVALSLANHPMLPFSNAHAL